MARLLRRSRTERILRRWLEAGHDACEVTRQVDALAVAQVRRDDLHADGQALFGRADGHSARRIADDVDEPGPLRDLHHDVARDAVDVDRARERLGVAPTRHVGLAHDDGTRARSAATAAASSEGM